MAQAAPPTPMLVDSLPCETKVVVRSGKSQPGNSSDTRYAADNVLDLPKLLTVRQCLDLLAANYTR